MRRAQPPSRGGPGSASPSRSRPHWRIRNQVLGDRLRSRRGDELYYEWDFNDDGEFERAGYASNFQGLPHADRVEHIYRDGGLKTVTLRVSDFRSFPEARAG